MSGYLVSTFKYIYFEARANNSNACKGSDKLGLIRYLVPYVILCFILDSVLKGSFWSQIHYVLKDSFWSQTFYSKAP